MGAISIAPVEPSGALSEDDSLKTHLLNALLRKAAAGDPLCAHALGELYRDGLGVTSNATKAASWFHTAAVQNHAPSEYELGWAYENGHGVTMDRGEAIRWYRRAAEQGHVTAQLRLGLVLPVDGRPERAPPSAEWEEGKRWLRLAAQQGHVAAQALISDYEGSPLGSFLEEGGDVKQWWKTAVDWFVQSADRGDREAAVWLARLIRDNHLDGWVEEDHGRDRAQPIYWFRRAAELGQPEAERWLAISHGCGSDGLVQDATQAFGWYLKAAEHGEADAMFEVAKAFLLEERGRDEEQARAWFKKAANAGVAEAHAFLGWMHLAGKGGLQKDDKTAFAHYSAASIAGDTNGMVGVATILELGAGVERDITRAIRLYVEAAFRGHPEGHKAIERLRSKNPLADSLSELLSLVGIAELKETVFRFLDRVQVDHLRRTRGLRGPSWSLHSIFSGPPGTGKTTVARILSRVLKGLGILRQGHLIEVDRAGMVGRYVGETAQKVSSVVDTALGGVLFIDEAYSLARTDAPEDYGREAIDTLVKRMEDYRNDFVVIAAGYETLMEGFLDSNPGLRSRFPWRFRFRDYTPEELLELFLRFAAADGLIVGPECHGEVRSLLGRLYALRESSFGNGRLVRNFYDRVLHEQAGRVARIADPTNHELQSVARADVQGAARGFEAPSRA